MAWGSNVFPLLIVTASGGFTGLFVYSPAPGAGNLIASIAAQGGTDPFGNSYLAGIISYSPATAFAGFAGGAVELGTENPSSLITTVGNINLDDALVASAQPGINIGSPKTSSGGQTQVAIFGESQDTTKPAQVVIATGVPAPATAALLEVEGALGVKNATAPASVAGYAEPFATGGNLVYVNGLAGDGQTYDTGTLHLVTSPAFTVSATAFPNAVPGVTVALGIGHYRFRCVINCTTAAGAGAPQFEFTFPSATGVMIQTYTPTSAAGNAQSNQNSFTATTSLSLAVGPTLNTHGFICVWEGDLTTTAAGNLALDAITNTLGDNYVVATVWLDLYPVN